MNALLHDLRYAMRMLAKSPGFAVVAVLTLALGIGANAAIFQLIDAVRLRTLPVKDPSSLAIVHIERNHWGQGSFNGSYSDFTFPIWDEIRKRQDAFTSIAVWGGQPMNLARGGEVDNADGIFVSGDFFPTLGVRPYVGRLISSEDDQSGCGGGAVLSYSFWQRRYGGLSDAVGKQISLQGFSFPILGVTPPTFSGLSVGDHFDVAVPVCAEPIMAGEYSRITGPRSRESWWLAMFGRLKPGWTLERATAQLDTIMPSVLNETIPPQYDADGVKHYLAYRLQAAPAANGFSDLRESTSTPLWLLLGLSGLVLLIACANLANLMLARATTREREIAVRLALGASRGRLTRQLLLESGLLALAGAVGGGVLASALSRGLVTFLSKPQDPIFLDMPTDWRVLGFSAALAVLTTMLFGLVPAWRTGSVPPGAALKTGGRGMTAGRERFRLQRVLVASQVALSLVLLASALLFARSLRNLMTRDTGFDQNNVLVVNTDFTKLKLVGDQRQMFDRDTLERVRAIAGVASAATDGRAPASGNSSNDWIVDDQGKTKDVAWVERVSPGYFATMGTPILQGRDFDQQDVLAAPKVAIVNQSFVRKFLDGKKDAVGQQFREWANPGKPEPYYAVVGVSKDATYKDMHDEFLPVMYFPQAQDDEPNTYVTFVIRSRAGLAGTTQAVRETMASVNPEIAMRFTVLTTQIRQSLAQDELMATLCGFFGGLAVLLAAIGLYGVISYTVAQRTNEIGIRMALGSQRAGIVKMILREVTILVAIGVVVGAGLTLAGSKAASSLLFGLKARDPLTLAVAVVILIGIGMAASFVPARRAASLDPMQALRNE
jgi:putative ABC transport system permease protein